jgi:hypothetical protein
LTVTLPEPPTLLLLEAKPRANKLMLFLLPITLSWLLLDPLRSEV